jgi:hypothetical protein
MGPDFRRDGDRHFFIASVGFRATRQVLAALDACFSRE